MVGMADGVLGLGVCAALTLLAASAAAEPHHSGFTGDLGIGVGITTRPVESFSECVGSAAQCAGVDTGVHKSTDVEFGLAPLSLSLGGFLTPKLALLFRATGTSYFIGNDQYLDAFYGAVVEYWPHDRFFFGGGPGIGYFGTNPLVSSGVSESETAFALDARAGVALINGRDHDLTLSLEATSGFYADNTLLSGAFLVAWKWY